MKKSAPGSKRARMNAVKAKIAKPADASLRGSHLFMFLPMMGVMKMARIPVGAITRPAHVGVYDICVCSQSGSSTTVPKKSM